MSLYDFEPDGKCYRGWIQNYLDMEAEDEPLRIHNTDAETDAVMVEHERETEHMRNQHATPSPQFDESQISISDEPDYDEQEEDENIPTESEELFRDKQKDPRTYCIWCGKVCKPLLCLSCRTKTIKAKILQRLNSP